MIVDSINQVFPMAVAGTVRRAKRNRRERTRRPVLDAANEGLLDVVTSGDLVKQGGVHCLRVALAGELKQSAIRGVDQRRPPGLDHQSKTQDLRRRFAVLVTSR